MSRRSLLPCINARSSNSIDDRDHAHAVSTLDELMRAMIEGMIEAHSTDPELYEPLATDVPPQSRWELGLCRASAWRPESWSPAIFRQLTIYSTAGKVRERKASLLRRFSGQSGSCCRLIRNRAQGRSMDA